MLFQEAQHVMQSAARAMKNGLPEDIVFACLLHDTGMALQMPDHGYVGAALYEPYVDEKVSWAIGETRITATKLRMNSLWSAIRTAVGRCLGSVLMA